MNDSMPALASSTAAENIRRAVENTRANQRVYEKICIAIVARTRALMKTSN